LLALPNEILTGDVIAVISILVTIILAVSGSIILLIFRSGKVMEHIKNIDNDLTEIKTDVKGIPALNDKVEKLWSYVFRGQMNKINKSV